MFDRWRAAGREVAVLGLARSGEAAALLLRDRGIPVYVSDAAGGPEVEVRAAALRGAGAAVETGGHDLARIARAAAVVVSPGVPPDAPPVRAALDAGVEVVAEVDVGWAALPGRRIAGVTGTNGKTTTTALVAHLLEAAGIGAAAVGNIGRALAEYARAPGAERWLALELSSFQLHDTHYLRLDLGLLTNLAPDHLDRYPALEAYYADKARLFGLGTADAIWVTNLDDPAVQAMAAGAAGAHRRFSTLVRADAWYDRSTNVLVLDGRPVLPRGELPLLGDHNVANALAALLAASAAGADPQALAEGLRGFRPMKHRLEPVREVGGVLWINDSKATNVASTEVALRGMTRPFVLLLGGRHKGEPYTRLAEAAGGRCRAVVAYGEAGDLVEADLGGLLHVVRAGTFAEVVATARRLARPGDAVLLSPACSSYDQFRNYEERGATFRAAVEAM
jgi:UDP-N-acetylmuramoylalanine--D-glutamate ligase